MTEQNLSPKLLHNLEQNYHNIEKLYNDNVDLEGIREELQISDEDMWAMEEIMFPKTSVYTIDNIFEGRVTYEFASASLKSKPISQEIEDGIKTN